MSDMSHASQHKVVVTGVVSPKYSSFPGKNKHVDISIVLQ